MEGLSSFSRTGNGSGHKDISYINSNSVSICSIHVVGMLSNTTFETFFLGGLKI